MRVEQAPPPIAKTAPAPPPRCNHQDVANFNVYDDKAYAKWPNILAGKSCTTCHMPFKEAYEDGDDATNTFVPGKGQKNAWGCQNCNNDTSSFCIYCLCNGCREAVFKNGSTQNEDPLKVTLVYSYHILAFVYWSRGIYISSVYWQTTATMNLHWNLY